MDGDVTGDVTGNVTGNVTGDLDGDVTGNLTGNVTGNVTGNLTGNVTSSGSNTLTTVSGTTATYTSFVGTLTGASSLVTVAADTTDTTTNILFVGSATGEQSVKSSTSLTFNAATGALSATSFAGDGNNLTNLSAPQLTGDLPALDGSALTDVVTGFVDITATNTTAADHFITFVDTAGGSGERIRTDSSFKYNPGTGTLTCTAFDGSSTGLSGDPSITVTNITVKGNVVPDLDDVRELGSSSVGWSKIYAHDFYCADMHFSNVGRRTNEIDGTSGSWTLQEGQDDIYMLNNITGKKYKISLTEV